MSQYGHITYRGGRAVLTPDGFGGVFVQLVTFNSQYNRYTFTDLDSMNIFGQIISGGYHTIVWGRDSNGYPYVEAAGWSPPEGAPAGDWETKVGVFAR